MVNSALYEAAQDSNPLTEELVFTRNQLDSLRRKPNIILSEEAQKILEQPKKVMRDYLRHAHDSSTLRKRIAARLKGETNERYLSSLRSIARRSLGFPDFPFHAHKEIIQRAKNAESPIHAGMAAALVYEAQHIHAMSRREYNNQEELTDLLFTACRWPGLTGEAVREQLCQMDLSALKEYEHITEWNTASAHMNLAFPALRAMRVGPASQRPLAREILHRFESELLKDDLVSEPAPFFDFVLWQLPLESAIYALQICAKNSPSFFNKITTYFGNVIREADSLPRDLQQFAAILQSGDTLQRAKNTELWLKREKIEQCLQEGRMELIKWMSLATEAVHSGRDLFANAPEEYKDEIVDLLIETAPQDVEREAYRIDLTRAQLRALAKKLGHTFEEMIGRWEHTHPTSILRTPPLPGLHYEGENRRRVAAETVKRDPLLLIQRKEYIHVDKGSLHRAHRRISKAEMVLQTMASAELSAQYPHSSCTVHRRKNAIDVFDASREVRGILAMTGDERETLHALLLQQSDSNKEASARAFQRTVRQRHRKEFLQKFQEQRTGLAEMQCKARQFMGDHLLTAGGTFSDVLHMLRSIELKDIGAADKKRAADLWHNESISLLRVVGHRIEERPLYALIEEYATRLHFTDAQVAVCKDTVKRAVQQSKNIHALRQKYPSDQKLFAWCFGREPRGEVQVVQGPITLYFRCADVEDYAYVHAGFDRNETVTPEQLRRAMLSGGIAISTSCGLPTLAINALTLENNGKKSPFIGEPVSWIYDHEELHAYQMLFRETEMNVMYRPTPPRSPENAQEVINSLYRSIRVLRELHADARAKQEILCFLRVGNEIRDIKNYLLRKGPDALYDYFVDLKKSMRRSVGQLMPMSMERIMKEIFDKQYVQHLDHALHAVDTLLKQGYTTEIVIELLMPEPLGKWRAFVRRLLINDRKTSIKATVH